MLADSAKKKIIILSDNNRLSRAIELNLSNHVEADVIQVSSGSPGSRESQTLGECNLIIVAASLPTSEPVVTLARASLTGQIGQIPLLIISDRPFHSDPGEQIVHLDFPFDIDELHHKVKEILHQERGPISGQEDHQTHQGVESARSMVR